MSGKAHSSPHQAVPDLMSLSSVDRLRLEMLIRQQQLDQHFLLEQQQQQGRVGQLLAQHVSGSASGSATQFPMAAPAPAPALFNTGSGSLLQPQNGQLLAAILRQQTAQNLPAQHPNAALVNFLCQPAVPSQTSLETLFQYQQQQQEQQRHASLREEETLPNGQGQLLAALDQILKQSQGQVSSRSARRQIQANLNPTGMLLHGHQPQSLASTTEASALSALECMLRQQHNAHSTALSDGILFPGQHHNAPCNAPLARLTDLQSVLILQEEKDTTQQEKGMSLTGPSANASTSSAFASSVQPPEKDGSKSLIGNTTGTNVTASDDTEDVDKQVESCDLNAISENKSKYQEEKEEEEDPNSDDDLRANDAFPFKLYRILERASEDGTDCIISFFPHGCSFAIHKAQEFVTEILPKYFTSTRLSSFQRQLNLYGFRRITEGSEKGGYYHEYFVKGKKSSLSKVYRKSTAKKWSSTSDHTNLFSPSFSSHNPSDTTTTTSVNLMALNGSLPTSLQSWPQSFLPQDQLVASESQNNIFNHSTENNLLPVALNPLSTSSSTSTSVIGDILRHQTQMSELIYNQNRQQQQAQLLALLRMQLPNDR